jgi:hypothetical protein
MKILTRRNKERNDNMIGANKARELTEKAKRERLEAFKAFLEKEKFSENVEKRANMGYSSAEIDITSVDLTVATEYFNGLGYSVCRTPHSPYSNKYTIAINW